MSVLHEVDLDWVVPQAVNELVRGDFTREDIADSGEQGKLVLLKNKISLRMRACIMGSRWLDQLKVFSLDY